MKIDAERYADQRRIDPERDLRGGGTHVLDAEREEEDQPERRQDHGPFQRAHEQRIAELRENMTARQRTLRPDRKRRDRSVTDSM